MRSLRYALLSPLVLSASLSLGQEKPRTDAQNDGFAGPVKSVSTAVTHANVKWSQPSGPTMVMPVWCQDCAYDPDGMKTRSGQMVEERFVGDEIELVRDPNGHVANRRRFNASTGELLDEEIWGPFGKTSETTYLNGQVSSRQTFNYDQYGHMREWLSLDSAGKQQSRNLVITNKDGVVTERSGWGKDDHLDSRETYDPETDVQHFTTYDESGSVKLTWTYAHGRVESFWAQSDSAQYGDGFTDFKDNGDALTYHCQKDSQCERSVVHYDYLSPNKRNPISAEWRDANGNLTLAAYYEYELDSFQNWTHRLVYVWAPDLQERALYEEDARNITYWPQ